MTQVWLPKHLATAKAFGEFEAGPRDPRDVSKIPGFDALFHAAAAMGQDGAKYLWNLLNDSIPHAATCDGERHQDCISLRKAHPILAADRPPWNKGVLVATFLGPRKYSILTELLPGMTLYWISEAGITWMSPASPADVYDFMRSGPDLSTEGRCRNYAEEAQRQANQLALQLVTCRQFQDIPAQYLAVHYSEGYRGLMLLAVVLLFDGTERGSLLRSSLANLLLVNRDRVEKIRKVLGFPSDLPDPNYLDA